MVGIDDRRFFPTLTKQHIKEAFRFASDNRRPIAEEDDKTIAEHWADEAEERLKAFKRGDLKTVSYEEVFEQDLNDKHDEQD